MRHNGRDTVLWPDRLVEDPVSSADKYGLRACKQICFRAFLEPRDRRMLRSAQPRRLREGARAASMRRVGFR